MPGPYPWAQFVLMCWPVWLALGTLAALGLLDWWAKRPRPHRHAFTRVGYGGAGWSVYRCPCGATDIDA